jgi:hypothetical protein
MVEGVEEFSPGISRYKEAQQIIDGRIDECSLKGHLKPFPEENICTYCFQHLSYPKETTPQKIAELTSLDRQRGIEELINMKELFTSS